MWNGVSTGNVGVTAADDGLIDFVESCTVGVGPTGEASAAEDSCC